MNKKQLTKEIILYLISKLGDKIEGKKKIMKLMFLTEHHDFDIGKLIPKNKIGNTFLIYRYGVFSFDVMECVDELIEEKVIKDGFPLKLEKEIKPELKEKIEKRVKKVIDKFGDKTGYDLEIDTLRIMGIKPYEKKEHFGENVSKIIKN